MGSVEADKRLQMALVSGDAVNFDRPGFDRSLMPSPRWLEQRPAPEHRAGAASNARRRQNQIGICFQGTRVGCFFN